MMHHHAPIRCERECDYGSRGVESGKGSWKWGNNENLISWRCVEWRVNNGCLNYNYKSKALHWLSFQILKQNRFLTLGLELRRPTLYWRLFPTLRRKLPADRISAIIAINLKLVWWNHIAAPPEKSFEHETSQPTSRHTLNWEPNTVLKGARH